MCLACENDGPVPRHVVPAEPAREATSPSTRSLTDQEKEYVRIQRELAKLRIWRKEKVGSGVPLADAQDVFEVRRKQIIGDSKLSTAEYQQLREKVSLDPAYARRLHREISSSTRP